LICARLRRTRFIGVVSVSMPGKIYHRAGSVKMREKIAYSQSTGIHFVSKGSLHVRPGSFFSSRRIGFFSRMIGILFSGHRGGVSRSERGTSERS
jgi:hypothetical protein